MARDKEHTEAALKGITDVMYRAALGGVRATFTEYPNTAHIHRVNTRRSLARDHIVHLLRGDLGDHAAVRIEDRNQTTYFHIRCPICEFCNYQVLVKKCDEFGAVALERTQASLEFQANEQPRLFDDEVTNLYLSYLPNGNDPLEPFVYLICPNEDGCDWVWELSPPAAEIAGEISRGAPPTPSEEADDLVRIPPRSEPDEVE